MTSESEAASSDGPHGPPPAPRRRRWRRALAITALLALVVAAAGLSAFYSHSKEEFVAGALSRYLGRYVEIGKIEIRAETELRLLIEDARIYAGPEKSGDTILEVARARGSQPWSRILVGQFVPRAWVARSLRTQLDFGGNGRGFDLRSLPSLALSLTDGQLALAFGDDQLIELSQIELTTDRSSLLRQLSGEMRGQISWNGEALGAFEADVSGHDEEPILGCEFSEIDLSAIPSAEDLPLQGVAEGKLRLRVSRDVVAGSLVADIDRFSLKPPKYLEPIAPEDLRVNLEFSWNGETLELRPEPLRADLLEITGQLALTFGKQGRLQGQLAIAPFEPGLPAGGRFQVMRFLALRHRSWQAIEKRVEAGRVVDGEIAVNIALADLNAALAMRSRTRPGELRYSARVENGIYRTRPDTPALDDLRGRFSIDADRLEIRDFSFARGQSRIPDLDITVDGMRRLIRLPKAERRITRQSTQPTPGLSALFSSLSGGGSSDENSKLEVHFSHAQLHYPPLLLPIRDARGVLSNQGDLLSIDAESVVVGGAPGRLGVRWQRKARRIAIDLHYDPEATAEPPGPDEGWFVADLFVDKLMPGGFAHEDLAGRVRANGDVLELRDTRGRFGGGALRANGRFLLTHESEVPFTLSTSVTDADPAAMLVPVGRPPNQLTGTLALESRFEGQLIPDSPFFETVDADLKVSVVDGEVSQDLPAFVQILRVPSLSGIAGLFGSNLPYDELSADFQIRNQVLGTENLTLKGPELQALVRGTIDLEPEPNDCDIVIEFLLTPTVDRMIDRVPIVGGIVLGENDSLVVFGVQLRGNCDEPNVRAMAPGSIETATAWARDLIGSGAGQLRRIILGPKEEEESDAESP